MAVSAVWAARTGASPAKPASLADGEMVVMCVNHDGAAPTVSGFTLLATQAPASGQSTNLTILYKKNVTAASEPATYSLSGVNHDSVIGRVAGYDTASTWGTPVGLGYGATGTTIQSPAYTPATADELLMHASAVWDDSAGFTASSGFTLTISRSAGDDALVEYKVLTGQNGTPQSAGAITGGTSGQCASISVGIRAAAGGGSTAPVASLLVRPAAIRRAAGR